MQNHILSCDFKSDAGQRMDWMCVLDIDEFLVLMKHESIQRFLTDYSYADGIVFNWALFNSGSNLFRDQGLTLDRFRSLSVAGNRLAVKTVARVRSIRDWLNPHRAVYKFPWWAVVVFPDGSEYSDSVKENSNYQKGVQTAVVNHYALRSLEEFLVKQSRGGGMNYGRDLLNPLRIKTFEFFDLHNAGPGVTDASIAGTAAYQKLREFMSEIINENDLKPFLNSIELKTSELVNKCWKATSAESLQSRIDLLSRERVLQDAF